MFYLYLLPIKQKSKTTKIKINRISLYINQYKAKNGFDTTSGLLRLIIKYRRLPMFRMPVRLSYNKRACHKTEALFSNKTTHHMYVLHILYGHFQ